MDSADSATDTATTTEAHSHTHTTQEPSHFFTIKMTTQKHVYPITRYHLRNVFKSQDFQKNLDQVIDTLELGLESQFNVYQEGYSKDFLVSPVEVGFSDECGSKEDFQLDDDPNVDEFGPSYTLLSLHSHPHGIFIPSDEDLSNLNFYRKLDSGWGIRTHPLSIILTHNDNITKLLIMQEKGKFKHSNEEESTEIFESYHKYLDESNPKSVAEVLRESDRYNAVGFELNEKNLIKKHEIKKLSSFDFTPKIYDEDTFNKYY